MAAGELGLERAAELHFQRVGFGGHAQVKIEEIADEAVVVDDGDLGLAR